MAAAPVRHLDQQRVNAVAVVGDEFERTDERSATPDRARAALAQARGRLAQVLLREIWTQSAALDVGIWGRAVTEVEADRTLRAAAEQGVIHIDPTDAGGDTVQERRGGPRRFLRRLIGADAE